MKKRHFKTKLILLVIIVMINVFIFDIEAKELVKTCTYTYDYELDKDGNVSSGAAVVKGGTITLKIYDDGTHEGEGKSNGEFLGEKFGGKKQILNWSSSADGVSKIGTDECPFAIGVIVKGLGTRKWYGFTPETVNEQGKKIADEDNSDGMWVLVWDEYDSNSFVCEYSGFSVKYDMINDELYVQSNENLSLKMFYYVSDALKKYWIEQKEKKECVAIYSCAKVTMVGTDIYLYHDLMSAYADDEKYNCSLKCLKGDESCEKTDCPTTTLYKQEIEKYFTLYSATNEPSNLIASNNTIIKVRDVCNTIFKNLNYGESCLNDCLNFQDWLVAKKKEYGIDSGAGLGGKCGLSWKLINFIGNIIKWVKYIIPVIVIVLGILDFIKAISSDKDDEMKKVQGKFVKRLISAALIFIIPFILEFVLNKMGFVANGCGIIDL